MNPCVPNYYKKFKCIAERCRHNCCIGWEIGIDSASLERYRKIPWIEEQIKGNVFSQDERGRCAFLNDKGLCKIIEAFGESALCNICTDHPRFRHFYEDGEEIGLGLCCEAAAEMILGQKEPMVLSAYEGLATPEESSFFSLRAQVFDLLQERAVPIETRLSSLTGEADLTLLHWIPFFQKLERLDPRWDALLAKTDCFIQRDPIQLEQLAVYFVYRHLAGCLEDGRFRERLLFAVLSTRLIAALPCPLEEGARMYSCEIEYSDENVEKILCELEQV